MLQLQPWNTYTVEQWLRRTLIESNTERAQTHAARIEQSTIEHAARMQEKVNRAAEALIYPYLIRHLVDAYAQELRLHGIDDEHIRRLAQGQRLEDQTQERIIIGHALRAMARDEKPPEAIMAESLVKSFVITQCLKPNDPDAANVSPDHVGLADAWNALRNAPDALAERRLCFERLDELATEYVAGSMSIETLLKKWKAFREEQRAERLPSDVADTQYREAAADVLERVPQYWRNPGARSAQRLFRPRAQMAAYEVSSLEALTHSEGIINQAKDEIVILVGSGFIDPMTLDHALFDTSFEFEEGELHTEGYTQREPLRILHSAANKKFRK